MILALWAGSRPIGHIRRIAAAERRAGNSLKTLSAPEDPMAVSLSKKDNPVFFRTARTASRARGCVYSIPRGNRRPWYFPGAEAWTASPHAAPNPRRCGAHRAAGQRPAYAAIMHLLPLVGLIQEVLDPLRPELEGLLGRSPFGEPFGEPGCLIVLGDRDHAIGQGVEGHHFRTGGP
jgi:hypothetical protein